MYKHLTTFLNRDKEIKNISYLKENSIYREWQNVQAEIKQEKERKRQAKLQKRKLKKQEKYFQDIKDADFWKEDYSKYDVTERQEIVNEYFEFIDTVLASEKLKAIFGSIELILEEYLDFKESDYDNEVLCRFVGEFESWEKIDSSKSYYDNFGEYLLEKMEREDYY